MARNAAVLFVGDARREEARKGLPARFLARLHASLTEVIESVEDVDLYLAFDRGETFLVDGPRFTSRSRHASLGEKVDDAITSCFAAGYARVAIVAGDLAGLTRELVVEAFAQTKPVIGRSPDGGFYLAAFSEMPDVDWTALPWSTASIHDTLLAQLDDPHSLPPLRDIDSLEDAQLLGLLPRPSPFVARRSHQRPTPALNVESPRPPPTR